MIIFVPPIAQLNETFALLVASGCDILSTDAPTNFTYESLALAH